MGKTAQKTLKNAGKHDKDESNEITLMNNDIIQN